MFRLVGKQGQKSSLFKGVQHLESLVSVGLQLIVEIRHIRGLRDLFRKNHKHFLGLPDCRLLHSLNYRIVIFQNVIDNLLQPDFESGIYALIERVIAISQIFPECRQYLQPV